MNTKFEYEVTCYKDKNYELGGKLFLSEDLYIDFDDEDIFINSKPIKLSPSDFVFLKELISNLKLTREYLGVKRFGEDYYEMEDKQINKTLSTIKWKINKCLNMEFIYFVRQGNNLSYFYVKLPKYIKRFDDIEKKDVFSIKALFPEAYAEDGGTEDSSVQKSLTFVKKFLSSGAQSLLSADGNAVLDELSSLSKVFRHLSTVNNEENCRCDVIRYLYELVVDGCHNETVDDILKIKGPLGSYKNRIMQYLYLAVSKNNNDIQPFYIDIAFYERIAESDIQVSEDDIIEKINLDFTEIRNMKNNNKDKIPLLFLDGIRDFSRGNENLYNFIRRQIRLLDCKLVICLDADFTANTQHCFNMHPLCANNFVHYMRISSMSLYKKEESIDFINNCISVFEVSIPETVNAKKIYENLIRMGFSFIDAYWLVYILRNVFNYLVDERCNIVDLYTAVCTDVLGNVKLLESAAEMAYEFEFESTFGNNYNLNYDIRWRLIRMHRSVLDFLLAKQYAKNILSLRLTGEKNKENISQLSIFNMIIQGHISRFAFTMLKGDEDYEYQIMKVAKSYYDELSMIGKSELTFRMTALENERRRKDCIRMLVKCMDSEEANYKSIPAENIEQKKDAAFLVRSIFINLIYDRNRNAFVRYFNMLMTDKLANSINRGFHLEYYGDKTFIPNKTLLDFEDDVTKGKKTFDMLCLVLNERMKSEEKEIYGAAIELVTLCNLIQARVEQNETGNVFNVRPYIGNCLKYLEWIAVQPEITELADVLMFFNWIKGEFEEMLSQSVNDKVRYFHSTPFNNFSIAKSVERAGWIKNNIPSPENIVEHMYNCWLIGMMYLPDEYDEDGYNKNGILQMLLLHDLVEAKTGNVNRPERIQKAKEYDCQENDAMQALLLSGTYPTAVDLSTYISYWNEWERRESVNYLVAKDIDDIQTIFQFCRYYVQYPDNFSDDDIVYWLDGVFRLETSLGEEIAEKLIINNPQYKEVVDLYFRNGRENYFN